MEKRRCILKEFALLTRVVLGSVLSLLLLTIEFTQAKRAVNGAW
jgi:hypothetical protein